MRTGTSFIKRNGMWLGMVLVILIIQEFYLFLLSAPMGDLLYPVLIELLVLAVVVGIAFFQYKKKIEHLKQLCEQTDTDALQLPEAGDGVEEVYQELLETINMQRKVTAGNAGRQQKEMQEYYAMWVHQIKTPIAALQLLLQMRRSNLNEEDRQQTELLGDEEEELFRIEQYVQMALQYQRIQDSGTDFVLKKNAIDEMVRETIRKYARTMIRKKVQIQYAGSKQYILTDEKWFTFVLEQVLSNAIKYTKKGTIQIEVIKEKQSCYVKVTDQGIGIRAEDLPRVFEKGYTGYNGHSDKRSTGIGLYLCKEILSKLGHTIRIESEVGSGTSVWIGVVEAF